MKQYATRFGASLLALALLLSAASCRAAAATMHLKRTQGTVSVSDGDGKDIPPLDGLGLYSGYGVGTRSASYAWIDLDEVKLAKLDQNSEISIEKEGKALDIHLKSGRLFFNVTEPLADDEIMNIRTSTLLVGVRGTSGWVEDNDGLSRVYLLAGKVECSAEGQTVQVSAGEFAELTADGELVVEPFPDEDIPAFVRNEVDEAPGSDNTEAPEATEEPVGDVTYSYRDGTLVISGTGRMENYTYTSAPPWSDHQTETETVVIEDGVTGIGDYAFYFYVFLTGVAISDSVASIGAQAFAFCALNSVTIPDSITSIGIAAFNGCDLTGITIPASVVSIGHMAFGENGNLTGINVASGNPAYTSVDGVLFSADRTLLHTYPAGKADTSYRIPEGVTSIGAYAFLHCYNLANVTIPTSVTSIGASAFIDCYNLAGVTIPASVTSVGAGAFNFCDSLTDVYYGGSEDQWNQIRGIESVDLPAGAAIHYNN